MPKLEFKLEGKLWFWEKKRFNALKELVETTKHQYVCKFIPDVLKILNGKYIVGEGGSHIWIHRKWRNHPKHRLAIIRRVDGF